MFSFWRLQNLVFYIKIYNTVFVNVREVLIFVIFILTKNETECDSEDSSSSSEHKGMRP